MDELEQIKKDRREIKERNARVEADKAWETSLFRKVLVAFNLRRYRFVFYLCWIATVYKCHCANGGFCPPYVFCAGVQKLVIEGEKLDGEVRMQGMDL